MSRAPAKPVNPQSPVSEGSPVSIRALLLDFGAVISVSVFERHRETEQILGLPPGTLSWMGPIAPESDPLWQAMQREIGRASCRERVSV